MDYRYIVFGGLVSSKKDGEYHYVSPRKVAKLYNLKKSECIFIYKEDNASMKFRSYNGHKLVRVFPDSTGKYDKTKLSPSKEDNYDS